MAYAAAMPDVPGLTQTTNIRYDHIIGIHAILTARQKRLCNPLQPKHGTLSTGHIDREKCPLIFPSQVHLLHLFPSRKMSPEPEKQISSEKKAEPGGSWKTNEKLIVPKNRLPIVR